jgi:glycosyltransferase involved in cell wall biosynthesis
MSRVSVIFTVLNEAAALPRLLDSLAAQTREPDEVVACDGGSRDATLSILRAERRFNLRVIEAPGANISRGRNLAIAAASHELVACTDVGVRLDSQWLENLTRGFTITDLRLPTNTSTPARADQSSIVNRQSSIAWAAGFFLPDPHTHSAFEMAMSATVLPALSDVRPETFLPSSRSVAFLKSAWAQAGGYPEWLDYCEDLVFDFAMRERCGPCAFAPDALVYFRPRSSLRSFFRQYYLYARGDGKAGLWFKRHLVRYGTYLVALPVLLGGIALPGPALARLACAGALLAGAAMYTRTPYRRLRAAWHNLTVAQKLQAALLVPLIRVTGDVAKMIGYPAGIWWRHRRNRAA